MRMANWWRLERPGSHTCIIRSWFCNRGQATRKREITFIVWSLESRASSSILETVRRWFTTAISQGVILGVLACAAGQRLAADDAAAQKTADTFFAGTVHESSAEMVTVGRTVRGRAESRTFRLTPDTKI